MGIPIVDHVMLSGATVIDGPEVPFVSTSQGGKLTPAFTNMFADIFRKVLDKTIKIPNVGTVRSNCPIAIVSDQNNNTPASLYDGLYRVTGDGTLGLNTSWFKSSGRYFTIPEVFSNGAYEMSFFTTHVLQSQYTTRWPTQQDKVNEFNSYCPVVSTGNAFVARRENRLFAYNMWINSNIANNASIPLQYNTASSIDLTFPAHTFAVIVESNSSLQVYLNNYRTDKEPLYSQYPNGMTWGEVQTYNANTFIPNPTDDTTNTIRTSTIAVSGCSSEPTYTLTDRGDHPASTVTSSFSGGVFTLNITGNGPSDITINCSGNASRPPVPSDWTMTPPADAPLSDPPSAPTGLSATAVSSSEIDLSWVHGVGAASYNVKRATVSGGPYTTIAADVAVTSYADTTVAANSTYYYVVSSVNSLGESANSSEAVGTTAPVVTSTAGPVADAYVNDGGSANSNFGTSTRLAVKTTSTPGDGFNRNTYLKFDVRALTNVISAKLILTPVQVDGNAALAYAVITNSSWTETGITWNNQPADSGTVFANVSGYTVGIPMTNDVTSVARSQAQNGGYLTIKITEPSPSAIYVGFASKEYATSSWRPVLQYTVSGGGTPPPVPAGLSASAPSSSQIDLTWTASTGATSYNVKRATASGGPYTTIATGVTATSFSDTALAGGTTYYYVVSAVSSGGESANSTQASATTIPAAPTGLTATAGSNQVALSWTASIGTTSYNVKRSTVSGGPYTTIASGVTATSYTDTTALNGTTYYYVVSAVNASGESSNSSQVSATPSAPTVPAAPTGLTASPAKRKISLSWTASADAISYNVKRATVSGGPYTTIATGVTTASYTNTGLASGTTYYYVVSAVNAVGESANSAQASAAAK
jgi:fibronectin type 3 domain-containing protein